MKKLLIIDNCSDCKHCTQATDLQCELSDRECPITGEIPDWCMLGDAPVVVKRGFKTTLPLALAYNAITDEYKVKTFNEDGNTYFNATIEFDHYPQLDMVKPTAVRLESGDDVLWLITENLEEYCWNSLTHDDRVHWESV